MSVKDQVDAYIDGLTLDAHGLVYAELARSLAGEIDYPPRTKDGGQGSVTSTVKELRACLADLQVIGAKRGDEVEDKGWGTIASIARAAEVRDASQSVPANKGGRGRGGRKAAG